MKIAAYRAEDYDDIAALVNDLGLDSAEAIVDVAFSVFGDDSMTLGADRDDVLVRAEDALRRAERRRV